MGKGGKKMAVSLRERPALAGKDATRFIEKAKQNEENVRKFAEKKMREYEERAKRNGY